jgi:hypothetical protein
MLVISEFKNPQQGETKIYTHVIETLITSKGDILKIRMSYDDKRCIIRSVDLMQPVVNFEGEGTFGYVPLTTILSHSAQYVQQLSDADLPKELNPFLAEKPQ